MPEKWRLPEKMRCPTRGSADIIFEVF